MWLSAGTIKPSRPRWVAKRGGTDNSMNQSIKLGSVLVALALVIGACTGGGASPTPGRTTAATTAPGTTAPGTTAPGTEAPGTEAPTEAPMTEAPGTEAPTITPEPTAPPAVTACEGGGTGGTLTGELTLWHSYGSGAGTESDALAEALGVVCGENPGLKVDVVGLDFGSLFNVYRLQAANGDPDLFVAPNDSLWELAEATLLQNVADSIDQAAFSQLALDGSSYTTTDGEAGIWQVPESLKAVALYYNKDTVATPPATTAELLTAVQGGAKVAFLQGIYHNFGWWGAFGGELMDDTGRCVASDTGVADSFQYLADLKAAGATFTTDYAEMADGFKAGTIDMIVDGPWAAGGYATDVANLGVAPMPEGPSGPALPMTGVDGYNINPYGSNVDLATAFANRMVAPDIQAIYAETAYHIPSANDVPPSDNEVSAEFAVAVENGALRPQRPELGGFWDNFGNALNQVLDEGTDPATAVTEACQAMNDANGL
jgi:arabinogalactan oligomer / maltooligosaccharide transport system substrate-binding protein